MSFRWESYLDVALALAPDAHAVTPSSVSETLALLNAEARYRCAISRAYYAAMSVCREWIRLNAPDYPLAGDAKEHGDVRGFFLRSGQTDEQAIGHALKQLAEWRRQADYDAALRLDWKRTAGAALNRAETICQRIEQP